MRRMKRLAAAVCACALLATSAIGEEEAAFVPYTQSAAVCENGTVTLTGERARVDFAYLRSLNADTVGWLYQESTGLSQPVLQSQDNEQYQQRAFDQAILSNRGSVYIEAEQSPDMDENVLYLHGSGREGACLEALNGYARQEYYDQHRSLRLLTPAGDYQAEVFASVKTGVKGLTGWYPAEDESLSEWCSRVCADSEIVGDSASLPREGERIALFVIRNSGNNRRLVCASLRPIRYETDAETDLVKIGIDRLESYAGRVQVGDFGEMMLYAQNDPVWGSMRYESELTDKYRHFEGGGCGPTAAAIVIANLADTERLPELRAYAKNGMGTLMCSCSVNRVYCNHTHVPYLLETTEEYLRYLPVALADFAAGNNEWGVNSRPAGSRGSNMKFFSYVCEIFGLRVTEGLKLADSLEMLKDRAGEAAVLCCALRGSPFTNSSHYVVIVGVDEEYFYVLDPWRRTEKEYAKTDLRGVLEYLSPGVVRISLENVRKTDLSPVCFVERGAADEVETALQ